MSSRAAAFFLVLAAVAAPAIPVLGGERPAGNPGSVWGGGHIMRDRKFQKHDLVMITVRDTTKTGSKLQSTYDRKNDISLEIAKAFGLARTKGGGVTYEPLTSTSKKPELDIQSARKHDNSGEIKSDDQFTARVSAEVVEIMPNGQLVLEARKRVKIGESTNTVILTGRVRPEDIQTDNTVESDRVADAHIQYNPEGAVGDANKRSWLTRFFDFVNIF